MSRPIYWYGGILFVVLQINFFTADFVSPHSTFQVISLIGSSILTAAAVIDWIVQNWPQIWAAIKKLRRPPID
jgi:hypothetical protein